MSQQIMTRELYKKLKKMDRRDMESYRVNLYQEAFTDGYEKHKASSPSVDLDKLHEKLLDIKGIGKVKAEAILGIIKEIMEVENAE